MKLISAGVPLGALMELGKDHAAAVDRTARQAVDLFDRYVRERIQAEGGETEAAEQTSELQSHSDIVGRHPLEKEKRLRGEAGAVWAAASALLERVSPQ